MSTVREATRTPAAAERAKSFRAGLPGLRKTGTDSAMATS